MTIQKDNSKKVSNSNELMVINEGIVSNYYNVFDHKTYVALAKHSQKIVTAVYMITDFMDTEDPLRKVVRENIVRTMSLLFGLVHSEKIDRATSLSEALNNLFAGISYLGIIYENGFVSEMNYRIVTDQMIKLQEKIHTQITKSLPYDRKDDKNQSIRDFTFSESFFDIRNTSDGETKGQKLHDKEPAESRETIKDTEQKDTKNKRTLGQGVDIQDLVLDKTTGFVKSNILKRKPRKQNNARSNRKDNILKILKQKRNASINDICALFKDCSSKTIQRDLSDLIDEGLVKKEGSRRWSKYNLNY